MQIDTRFLMRNNNERDDIRRRIDKNEDEEEETLTYMKRERPSYLNDEPGIFGSVFDDSKSLNKAPNIFDATAVFHTKRDSEGDEGE
ncbi:MAG: hypothetical protein K6F00_01645 [Lachnospiraceae bacterium]|nr:hypothetical protein [Lachnospiraceae bacterium]